MEALTVYMLKSVIWISGFALVFFLFLRNERYFLLKRIYLISGILTSFIFPFISIRYYVDMPSTGIASVGDAIIGNGIKVSDNSVVPLIGIISLSLWLTGALFVAARTAFRTHVILKTIRDSEIIPSENFRLVRSDEYTSSFSFFSYVVVNPSITDIEAREIMNHEMIHVRQRHWIDLLLIELLCVIQWFNPVVWVYLGFIRQNHEYLADEGALQQTSDPAVYRAALLNQIAGSTVISLANSFSYSLNKKRFNMMKNTIISPYRKLRLLLILPVLAIVLASFAQPEYRKATGVPESPGISGTVLNKEIKGIVVTEDGQPLSGAAVVIQGTTIGTVTDSKGKFMLKDVPEDAIIVISYVGFETKAVKAEYASDITVRMVRGSIRIDTVTMAPPPPPPPPPPPVPGIGVKGEPKPLIVLDGKVKNVDLDKIDPETIQSVNVIKGEDAVKKYGEKGKNGVLEIVTKASAPNLGKEIANEKGKAPDVKSKPDEIFVVVEEMPEFPGGQEAMLAWISNNLKYPDEAVRNKITGVVIVRFTVGSTGKISDISVVRSANPLLDAEAVRVVGNMPDWKPGHQSGKAVDVYYTIPVEFKLK